MQKSHKSLFLIIWLLYSGLVYYFWFVTDDAYISLRYARNFAEGHGLRYNLVPGVSVEGYSNLLWVLIGSAIHALNLNPEWWMPFISYCIGSSLLYCLCVLLIKGFCFEPFIAFVAVLLLALFPPFAVWSTGGLETMLFAFLLFLVFYYFHCSQNRAALIKGGFLILLLSLCRPEGLYWGVLIMGVRYLRNTSHRQSSSELILPLLLVFFGICLQTGWRYYYYGEFFPNTVHAKSGMSQDSLLRGFRYLMEFCLSFPSQFLIMLACVYVLWKRFSWLTATIVLIILGHFAWVVVVGGDFMAMGRFFVSALPFQCFLLAIVFQCLWGEVLGKKIVLVLTPVLLILNILPAWNLHLTPRKILSHFHFRHNSERYRTEYEQWVFMQKNTETWKKLGLGLKQISKPGDSVVLGAVGAVGYFSNLFIYDRFGLVNLEVARLPVSKRQFSPGHDKRVPPGFFLPEQPTYLYAELYKATRSMKVVKKMAEFWKRQYKGLGYAPELSILSNNILSNNAGDRQADLIVVLRKLEEGEDEALVWSDFDKKLENISKGVLG